MGQFLILIAAEIVGTKKRRKNMKNMTKTEECFFSGKALCVCQRALFTSPKIGDARLKLYQVVLN